MNSMDSNPGTGEFIAILLLLIFMTMVIMVVWGSYLRRHYSGIINRQREIIKDQKRQLATVRIISWGTGLEGMDEQNENARANSD